MPDPVARRYLHTTIHADLATEPHRVNGLVAIRNVLKSTPGYGMQYTFAGGMQQLTDRLAATLTRTDIRLGTRVTAVGGASTTAYRVATRQGRVTREDTFDAVVAAIPHAALADIEWRDPELRDGMARHVAHYDRPAHYLRIAMLFDRPFWRPQMSGSWVMLDAFGGCCVYDESPAGGTHGVLGWLLAGDQALTCANLDDARLADAAVAALPDDWYHAARAGLREAKVHRWVGALSGQPGGCPLRDPDAAHRPVPAGHPRLVTVGDYLFDSTLNGVLRSAGVAARLVLDGTAATRAVRSARPGRAFTAVEATPALDACAARS
ncbi:MAG: FAD-dependent oxidoreductase [Vicinamibacterales bacterium]